MSETKIKTPRRPTKHQESNRSNNTEDDEGPNTIEKLDSFMERLD
jgi:hypothetical protein